MDIAKYIALFLLKNKYCCLQGLGNLDIKKTAANHDGTAIQGAAYYAVLNPIGSLDDAFPNFIANNEQVSIAKASNEISDFIKASKATIAAGGSVVIPSVGEYVQKNNQLHFELDAAFSMPASAVQMPIVTPVKEQTKVINETQVNEFPSYNNYNAPKSINWNLVAFWAVIALIGGGILAWSIKYFYNQNNKEVTEQAMVQVVEPPIESQVPIADSSILPIDSSVSNAPVVNGSDTPEFKFVIKEYKTLAQAEKKEKQLNSYGYKMSVIAKDSTTFFVVSALRIAAADTTKVKDSLGKLLNPGAVYILP